MYPKVIIITTFNEERCLQVSCRIAETLVSSWHFNLPFTPWSTISKFFIYVLSLLAVCRGCAWKYNKESKNENTYMVNYYSLFFICDTSCIFAEVCFHLDGVLYITLWSVSNLYSFLDYKHFLQSMELSKNVKNFIRLYFLSSHEEKAPLSIYQCWNCEESFCVFTDIGDSLVQGGHVRIKKLSENSFLDRCS